MALLPLRRRRTPEIVAAVDLGSNSFHMVVARQEQGTLKVLDRIKEMVRLAAGLGNDGLLAPDAIERSIACLERFGQRLRELPRGSVRAVGTNTLRNACNAREFMQQAEQALGHPIEVVSGVEEARLVYLGVADGLADDGLRRLVVDIGGGSTELIVGASHEPRIMESLEMGCVAISQRYFANGKFDKASVAKARQAVLQELEPVERRYRRAGWEQVVGTAGTIRAVQSVISNQGWSEGPITADGLAQAVKAVLKAGSVKKLDLKGLGNDRAPVFIGGVLVLEGVFRSLGIETMEVSEGALREGLLYDLLGRFTAADIRDQSVSALASRYHVDGDQAAHVQATALDCFAQLADDWELDHDTEQWLSWAAQLHEIGLDIAHSQYHKHGEYIARHADLAGFSQRDQLILSTLIRTHRRKLNDNLFKELPDSLQRPVSRLAILLRLAVVLHRGRPQDGIPPVRLELDADNGSLGLALDAGWYAAHPLAQADLDEEARYLKGLDMKLDFRPAD
ncbi:exopolyphosphatase [Methylonatrum kenyense]|uniref:exopolyphosphatase n=1 Tax=Methylonatrum kenyense TaxID=455253 RepID=UPI0020BFA10C|nr:exopolyphosphatase [Methylonatrum kenyense]MCK8515702.1 exopolyphosphatase [Methylonatrum kenyense]